MTKDEILNNSPEFRYMLLDRLKQDCQYFLGNGNRMDKYLWAGNVHDQIEMMRELWNSFPADGKPEWLTLQDISSFEAQMSLSAAQEKRSLNEICSAAINRAEELNAARIMEQREKEPPIQE